MKALTIEGKQYNVIDINTISKRALIKLSNNNIYGGIYAVLLGKHLKEGLTLDGAKDLYYNNY